MENLQPTFPQPSDTACLQAMHPQRAPAQAGSSELTQHQALWCLWTWLGTEPGGQQGFSVWLQTEQCPRRGLSDPCWLYPQRRAAHSLGLPTHTQDTHLQTTQTPPSTEDLLYISDIYLWLVYFRKEGKEPQQIQTAITSAVITHTVTLQKIKFTTVQRCVS